MTTKSYKIITRETKCQDGDAKQKTQNEQGSKSTQKRLKPTHHKLPKIDTIQLKTDIKCIKVSLTNKTTMNTLETDTVNIIANHCKWENVKSSWDYISLFW